MQNEGYLLTSPPPIVTPRIARSGPSVQMAAYRAVITDLTGLVDRLQKDMKDERAEKLELRAAVAGLKKAAAQKDGLLRNARAMLVAIDGQRDEDHNIYKNAVEAARLEAEALKLQVTRLNEDLTVARNQHLLAMEKRAHDVAQVATAPIPSLPVTAVDMLRTDEPTVPIGEIVSSLQSQGVSAIPAQAQCRLHRLARIKPHMSISESQLLLLVTHDAELDFEKDHADDLVPQDHHLHQRQELELHPDIPNTSIPNGLSDDGHWSGHPTTSAQYISSSPSLPNEMTTVEYIHRRHTPELTRTTRSKTTTARSNESPRKFNMKSPAWVDTVDVETGKSPFIQNTTDNHLNIMTDGIDPVTKRLYHAERALAKAHADADDRASEWRADITAVTGELDAKKREAADLKVAEHALQSQVEALEAVIEKLNLQVSGLQTQIGQHVASIKAHEEKLGHCA
ncbi:hypothetical protein SeLEV6574_g06455, partial [Synchytrium endobioticum]